MHEHAPASISANLPAVSADSVLQPQPLTGISHVFAFVFPGQGSQSVGMLAALAPEPLVQETFAEASEVLGYDLWKLCQDGPEDRLGSTERTQPAMLTAGRRDMARLAQARRRPCRAMAGHSLGEYSALVCSGALDFRDGRRPGSVSRSGDAGGRSGGAGRDGRDPGRRRRRGRKRACREAAQGEVVQAANFNSPGQVVIAGAAAAVDRAIEVLKSRAQSARSSCR